VTNSKTGKFLSGYKGGIPIPIPENTETLPFEIRMSGFLPAVLLLEDYRDKDECPFSLLVRTDEVYSQVKLKQVVKSVTEGLSVACEDKTGRFSNSQFEIVMHPAKITGFGDNILSSDGYDVNYLVDLASSCLNTLINAYGYAWKREGISAPEAVANHYSKDWYPIVGRVNMSPLTNISVHSYDGNVLFEQAHVDYNGTGCGLGMRLSEPQLSFLQDACSRAILKDHSYYQKLANRYFSSSEFEAFILMVATFIDKLIFEHVREYLELSGLTADDLETKMHTGRKSRRGNQSISREEALKLIFGTKNFVNDKIWKDFENNVIVVRDEIVHGSILAIEKNIAQKAMDSCNKLIPFLGQKIQLATSLISKDSKQV
jgi:hypothetical protein